MKRLVVGLSGGVGSGKSTIAAIFRKRGFRVIDADAVGHRVLERPEIRALLVRAWGTGILRGSRVNRAALARAAFRSRKSVRRLNRIVHPGILLEIRRRIAAARGGVVLDAALLFESGLDRACDRVLFVAAPREVRARRAAARGWAPGEVEKREKFQRPLTYKEKRADYVINNAGPKSRTEKQIEKIDRELKTLL